MPSGRRAGARIVPTTCFVRYPRSPSMERIHYAASSTQEEAIRPSAWPVNRHAVMDLLRVRCPTPMWQASLQGRPSPSTSPLHVGGSRADGRRSGSGRRPRRLVTMTSPPSCGDSCNPGQKCSPSGIPSSPGPRDRSTLRNPTAATSGPCIKIERPGSGDFARGSDERGHGCHALRLDNRSRKHHVDVKQPEAARIIAAPGQKRRRVCKTSFYTARRRGWDGLREARAIRSAVVCDIGLRDDRSPGPTRGQERYALLIQARWLGRDGHCRRACKAGPRAPTSYAGTLRQAISSRPCCSVATARDSAHRDAGVARVDRSRCTTPV